MTVYCLREKAQANKKMVKILREMLVLQSKDKDFLMNKFSAVADESTFLNFSSFIFFFFIKYLHTDLEQFFTPRLAETQNRI